MLSRPRPPLLRARDRAIAQRNGATFLLVVVLATIGAPMLLHALAETLR